MPAIPLRLKRIGEEFPAEDICGRRGIRHAFRKGVSRKRKQEKGSSKNYKYCFHPVPAFV
jgi:hypothetical protein